MPFIARRSIFMSLHAKITGYNMSYALLFFVFKKSRLRIFGRVTANEVNLAQSSTEIVNDHFAIAKFSERLEGVKQ